MRELENAMERAVALARGGRVGIDDLPEEIRKAFPMPVVGGETIRALDEVEKEYILAVLELNGGNQSVPTGYPDPPGFSSAPISPALVRATLVRIGPTISKTTLVAVMTVMIAAAIAKLVAASTEAAAASLPHSGRDSEAPPGS